MLLVYIYTVFGNRCSSILSSSRALKIENHIFRPLYKVHDLCLKVFRFNPVIVNESIRQIPNNIHTQLRKASDCE